MPYEARVVGQRERKGPHVWDSLLMHGGYLTCWCKTYQKASCQQMTGESYGDKDLRMKKRPGGALF